MGQQSNGCSEEFRVTVGGRRIVPRLLSPPREKLASDPLLLLALGADRESALTVEPYAEAPRLLLEHGHRALSFDLPAHGARVDEFGEGLPGLCKAFLAGRDPFVAFVEEASAVIDSCIERGVARAGRIVLYGTSRGAYFGLRLMAADRRVAAAAAIAPLTDWRTPIELAHVRERREIADLRLSGWADGLAGRPIYIAIGAHDDRVSTPACCRFYLDLVEANARKGYPDSLVDFFCTDSVGHSLDNPWRIRGAEFLLKALSAWSDCLSQS